MQNTVSIITGASTGIGRATAIEFSKQGSDIFLVARNERSLQETKKLVDAEKGRGIIVPTDLGNLDSINALFSSIKKQASHINHIINIAGIWHGKDEVYAGKDLETFDQQIIVDTYTVGLTAPTLLVHGLLPLMPTQSKVINLSGTFENGAKGWLPYYASKRAIEDLTLGLADELQDKDIQVNCISPSDTATDQYAKYFPQYMDEAIEPSLIAKQIVALCEVENKTTGKVLVMKKGMEPFEGFHS